MHVSTTPKHTRVIIRTKGQVMQTVAHCNIYSHSIYLSRTPGILISGQKTTTKMILWDIITHSITFILQLHGNQLPNLKINQMLNIKLGDPIPKANPRATVTMLYMN